VVLFSRSKKNEKLDTFKNIAPKYEGEFVFAISDNKERDEKELAKYLGAELN